MGEEGIEENGQEQWEGKVKGAMLIIDIINIILKNPCSNAIKQTLVKVKEAIDLAGQKSAAGRVKAVEALCTGKNH